MCKAKKVRFFGSVYSLHQNTTKIPNYLKKFKLVKNIKYYNLTINPHNIPRV